MLSKIIIIILALILFDIVNARRRFLPNMTKQIKNIKNICTYKTIIKYNDKIKYFIKDDQNCISNIKSYKSYKFYNDKEFIKKCVIDKKMYMEFLDYNHKCMNGNVYGLFICIIIAMILLFSISFILQ